MSPRKRIAIISLLGIGLGTAFVAMLLLAGVFYSSTQRLHQITQDLYVHPFAVSNAAASLKSSLYQMRSSALLMVATKMQGDDWKQATDSINENERQALQALAVIKESFLGDLAKVRLIETRLDEWRVIRSHILDEVRQGNFSVADQLIQQQGSPKFNEIIELTDYVLSFARTRARQFIDEGEAESDLLIRRGNLLSLILIASFLLTSSIVVWRVRYLQNTLSQQATTDFLTGIANRRHFLTLVEAEIGRYSRYGGSLSLAVVDLDVFKNINDTYGHHGGDSVLKGFCAICRKSLRETDVIGRLGGEEFGILMPNTSITEAASVIERLREAIERTIVPHGELTINFTASFGLATAGTLTAESLLAELFRCADEALYQAKNSGRNRVVIAQA